MEDVLWSSDRAAALVQLEEFLPHAGRLYASNRNHDLGPERRSNVSLLSPWLRHRVILEEEVLRETLKRHSPSSASKFVQEVFWRTYFKGWLEQHPQVWLRYRSDVDELVSELDRNTALRARYDEAVEGRTGIDCFDAWVAELTETGYLHNHARMWFASIWVFTLQLPWPLGADFFLRHLLDGDPASNTLGWRWVSGLHTKGKTYLARASNIAKYTGGRFDPQGSLAATAAALEEPDLGAAVSLPSPQSLDGDGAFGLLITEEDCAAELLSLPVPPRSVIGLTATNARSPLPVASGATSFAHAAVADAVTRAGRHFGVPGVLYHEGGWGSRLVDWARSSGVATIATAYPPVGPIAGLLSDAEHELRAANVRLVRLMRCYDRTAWPHANKGFFALKAKIPTMVSQLDLSELPDERSDER